MDKLVRQLTLAKIGQGKRQQALAKVRAHGSSFKKWECAMQLVPRSVLEMDI